MNRWFGGIEAGGTKFICLVGAGPNTIVEEIRIPTTTPVETIGRALKFFEPYARRGELAAVGIASFGPVDLNPSSSTYGCITTTPKPGWAGVDLRGQIHRALHLPVAFDTDVNAAAFGEHTWNPENHSLESLVYMTVGTGIGVGVIANGRPLHGLLHSEAGHMAVPHDINRDPFPGICPYHGDCLEGLACGPALARRWGCPAEALPAGHPAWELEGEYLAFGLANLVYTISPQRIVLGGGVAQHPDLHEIVRRQVQRILNGYLRSPLLLEKMDQYLVPPALGSRSGVLGAIAMARQVAERGG
ncbi:MAG: ROK family protein [Anaerolineae bacterium]|nr:ROK family protein [Anaerolineae bacterium]